MTTGIRRLPVVTYVVPYVNLARKLPKVRYNALRPAPVEHALQSRTRVQESSIEHPRARSRGRACDAVARSRAGRTQQQPRRRGEGSEDGPTVFLLGAEKLACRALCERLR